MNALNKVYAKDPNIVFRKISEQAILVPIKKKSADLSSVYTLNEVGARVWELIDGKTTLARIKAKIAEEYEISPQEAGRDVDRFLAELESAGCIIPAKGN